MARIYWLLVPLAVMAVAATAFWLNPDPSGLGTHRGLGLPPCLFLTLTGLPCPSCGLTTSLAWTMRGNLGAAFRAHPFGPILLILFAWASLLSLLRWRGFGSPFGEFFKRIGNKGIYAGIFLFLGVWIIRLWI